MLQWLRRRARERINSNLAAYLRANYTPAQVLPERGLFNFRCHENSVEWHRLHPDHAVVEVIYLDEGEPILHYVVRDPAGRLLEVTLGWRATELQYFVIRDIVQPFNIHKEFTSSMEYWTKRFTTRFDRLIGIDRAV